MTHSTSTVLGFLCALAWAQSSVAQPVPRTPVAEIRPLLVRALEHGTAHGVLVGIAATYARNKFDASTPIEIDVRTLHDLPQPGCSRLEVTTRQQGVRERSDRSDQRLTYQVSFCRNGQFPEQR